MLREGERVSLADRLKSLTEEGLGESESLADSPLAGWSEGPQELINSPSTPARPQIDLKLLREKLLELVKNSKFPELEESLAWRCNRIFQSNGRICGEINGLVVGKREVRKSCKKCQQLRTNSKTIVEEIVEIVLKEEGINNEH